MLEMIISSVFFFLAFFNEHLRIAKISMHATPKGTENKPQEIFLNLDLAAFLGHGRMTDL